jgi:hypothetical protein
LKIILVDNAIMDKEMKIELLMSRLFSRKGIKIPKGLRVFFIGKGNYVRVHQAHVERGTYVPEFRLGKQLDFDRGKILDFFAKLEFLVNELFFLKMIPNDYENGYVLDKLLEKISFLSRVRVLKDIGTISSVMYKRVEKINSVRNEFAHVWGDNEVEYEKRPLRDYFEEFKNDAETVWKYMEEIYVKEQEKIDFDNILKQLDELNAEDKKIES